VERLVIGEVGFSLPRHITTVLLVALALWRHPPNLPSLTKVWFFGRRF
jgi:hypothetical protein